MISVRQLTNMVKYFWVRGTANCQLGSTYLSPLGGYNPRGFLAPAHSVNVSVTGAACVQEGDYAGECDSILTFYGQNQLMHHSSCYREKDVVPHILFEY